MIGRATDYCVTRVRCFSFLSRVTLLYHVSRTTKRAQTFHSQESSHPTFGTVCHIPMSPSFCGETAAIVAKTAKDLGMDVHDSGTIVTIEGPRYVQYSTTYLCFLGWIQALIKKMSISRFSSKAESLLFKSWGCDVINMTTVPEVSRKFDAKSHICDFCNFCKCLLGGWYVTEFVRKRLYLPLD